MKLGVFALQGAFEEHCKALEKLGAEAVEIRRRAHFSDGLDGLVFPGGESTVQGKLLREEGLFEPVREALLAGMPAFGTCAGLILLAEKLSGDPTVHLGVLHATVRRNAYGRQLGSFKAELAMDGVEGYPAVFIRAPYVESVRGECKAIAQTGGHIVAVRQGNLLATSFHPELTDDLRVHQYFLDMVRQA